MTTLHIHCGDSSADTLRRSGVAGDVMVWREIYTEGPVPGGLSEDAWRRTRAEFLTSFGLAFDDVLRGINERYEQLAHAGTYDEVVLWFDACMFDQTIMVHLIDRLSAMPLGETKLTLICISDRGLGELRPAELAALLGSREAINPRQVRLAHDAWAALTSSNPRDIESFLKRDSAALPHVAPALKRHLEQYPSVRNGLNRLQNQALNVVASGTGKLGPIFTQTSAMEEQRFLGDSSMWACLDGMANGAVPFLTIAGPGSIVRPINDPLTNLGQWTVTMTDKGRAALRGEADWVWLNGIDRWLGGVHLQGAESAWRWDEQNGTLVSQGNP